MKSINNIIEFYETGRISLFEISERYYYDFFDSNQQHWVFVSFITGFQECNVYTKKGTILTALQKLEGATTFPIVFNVDGKRLSYDETDKVVDDLVYNNSFNCHGFTFLNGKFWFLLDNQKAELLIQENDYTPCTLDTLQEGGICLYYNYQNQLIHSAKMLDGVVQSKFGINTIITRSEQEIIDKYEGLHLDTTKSKYFNVV